MLRSKRAELANERVSRDAIAVERVPEAMDDVQHTANREISIASMSRHWRTIRAIDAALDRIGEGAFGECEACGEAISERRLQAIPWAHLCLNCQEAEDAAEDAAAGGTIPARAA
ncbi:MAG: TraR/DksA family transcriptional regulator [Bryobacteraceae bacterium]